MKNFNAHLDVRNQIYTRIADKILRNPDYTNIFISNVCYNVDVTSLVFIEQTFDTAIQKLNNNDLNKN